MLHKTGLFMAGFGAVMFLLFGGISVRFAIDGILEGVWLLGALSFSALMMLAGLVFLTLGRLLTRKFDSQPNK